MEYFSITILTSQLAYQKKYPLEVKRVYKGTKAVSVAEMLVGVSIVDSINKKVV